MQLSEIRTIDASREMVWAGILSPDVLKECLPGCREMSGSVSGGYEAVVVQRVGPVKVIFKGAVRVSDLREGESLTLSGEGKGGVAGFAKGKARLRLEDAGDEKVLLHYDVEAQIGGKLAQLGSRVLDSFARKMAGKFFTRFQEVIENEI